MAAVRSGKAAAGTRDARKRDRNSGESIKLRITCSRISAECKSSALFARPGRSGSRSRIPRYRAVATRSGDSGCAFEEAILPISPFTEASQVKLEFLSGFCSIGHSLELEIQPGRDQIVFGFRLSEGGKATGIDLYGLTRSRRAQAVRHRGPRQPQRS